jgi:hypothetical protein
MELLTVLLAFAVPAALIAILPGCSRGCRESPRSSALSAVRQAYCLRMTMLSFRVEESDARQAQSWAERLGVDRSELLRDALVFTCSDWPARWTLRRGGNSR